MMHTIFPCTVLDEILDISDEYNTKLYEYILKITPRSETPFACYTTFWTKNLIDDNLFFEFKTKIEKCTERFGDFVIDQMWASVTPYGCYHGTHSHGSHPLCGVYYVNVPKHPDGYYLRFMNDKWTLRGNEVDWPIETKKVLLFEGWVLHGYSPNPSYSPKVSVAFNFRSSSGGGAGTPRLRTASDNSLNAPSDNVIVTPPDSTVSVRSL